AAVLPCYWIYWEVGKTLLKEGSSDPLYRRWIETYGGEGFAAVVQAVLDLTDELGGDISAAEEARMVEHFRTTSRYEWMFWDMGYRKEDWPVGASPGS
ncbi:MAG TPA: thiaminase II, partial [Actinomycetota bacterium]|nr:thiaminase II [Actinomycetota bacterium]